MKKIYSICLAMLLFMMLSGCSTSYPDTDTVYIQKNGSVQEATVESFEKDYYSEEELKEFITAAIEAYEEEHEDGGVEMKSFEIEEGTAKLMMKYDSCKNYEDFNGRELFAGTVVQTIAAGYSFDTDFVEVEDGALVGGPFDTEQSEAAAGAVSVSEVTSNEDYKVVVLNEDTDVVVKGQICYVSAGSVTVKDKKTASVTTRNEGLSYIVYK